VATDFVSITSINPSKTLRFSLFVALGIVSVMSTGSASATSSAKLPKLPTSALSGAGAKDVVLVPVTRGFGSAKLRAYTPQGKTLFIQFSCVGPGSFEITGYFKISSCNYKHPAALVEIYPHQAGRRVSPRVIAPKGVKWEAFISSGQ
jgi:hypothetical protein